MSLVSGLNADTRTIQDGQPVAGAFSRLQLDHVILAGGSVLAAGLAKSGAIVKGVVNVYTDGVVDMDNWSKVTGTQHLTVGQAYRLSSQLGKLTTTGNGQLIGLAVSKAQLSLQIGLGSSGTSTSVSTSTAGLATLVNLANEAALRIAGDAALNAAIAVEIIARIAGDAALQAQIAALSTSVSSTIEVACGTVAIANGVDSGSVAGIGLLFDVSRVLLSVRKPVGGLNLQADCVGTPTSYGFDYTLNGITDSADYTLDYAVFPVCPDTFSRVTPVFNDVPLVKGTYALLNGVENGSVTGLGLAFTPAQVFVSVRKPVLGLNLFSTVAGAPTSDGFDFDLSGLTDSADYKLDYMIAPPNGTGGSYALGNGVEDGAVTGLGLLWTPTAVILTVRSPEGGLQLFATLTGDPTADGFTFTLSGLTDSANYILDYVLL